MVRRKTASFTARHNSRLYLRPVWNDLDDTPRKGALFDDQALPQPGDIVRFASSLGLRFGTVVSVSSGFYEVDTRDGTAVDVRLGDIVELYPR